MENISKVKPVDEGWIKVSDQIEAENQKTKKSLQYWNQAGGFTNEI
jgi:hypothetical protein